MKFVKNHKILAIVVVGLLGFVAFNLTRERSVKRVPQDNAPSVSEVDRAVEPNNSPATTNQEPLKDNIVKTGMFVNGVRSYQGQGTAQFVVVDAKPVLRLEDDFKASSGPDLHVYISKNADAKMQGLGEFVTLGALQSNNGAQVYNLPDDYKDYASIVIWCRAFKAVFAQATLQ